MTTIDFQKYIDLSMEAIVGYAPTIIAALTTLFVGFFIIKKITNALGNFFDHKDFDPSLESFLHSLVSVALKVILIVIVAGMVGVQTTSLIAMLGAAGLAVGLALQGSLANFAGGVLILLFKPFVAGDYIAAQGTEGTVEKIHIFNTILTTGDNQTIIIPNGILSNDVITNYSTEGTARVDVDVSIGYDDDIKLAKNLLHDILHENKKILEDPTPKIFVESLGTSAINIRCRVYVQSDDAFTLKYDIFECAKNAFDQEGISIPYPQRDVHLYKKEG